ncbi:hypothetical protein AAMO2058_000893200 [Amorphochlora amoebiformis]
MATVARLVVAVLAFLCPSTGATAVVLRSLLTSSSTRPTAHLPRERVRTSLGRWRQTGLAHTTFSALPVPGCVGRVAMRAENDAGASQEAEVDAVEDSIDSIKPVDPPSIETQEVPFGSSVPFGFYLIGSGLVSIASIGSGFEIAAKNPVFGVIPPESPLWLPILAFFAITGIPSAIWLFTKGVQGFNSWQEAIDRMDGYDRMD